MAVSTVKATINGVQHTLTFNGGTGKYEATLSAPSGSSYNENAGHYYPVSVTALDVAGNSTTKTDADPTLGDSLKLVVKEKVLPVIAFVTPTNNAVLTNNKPAFQFTIVDLDSGVDPDTIKLTIGASEITGVSLTKTVITNGYNVTYTPAASLPDGTTIIKADGDDFDGNVAVQKVISIKIDTVAPTLNISSPSDGLITNAASVHVIGVTNDVTSSPVTVTIKLGGVDQGVVALDGGGNFDKTITLAEGSNIILITSTDGAGKITSITRTVNVDTAAPTISAVTITPNPVDAGQTYVIAITVAD